MTHERIINFEDHRQVAQLTAGLRQMKGRWRIDFTKYRKRRTDPQNRYYYGVIVKEFHRFLRDQGETYTRDRAHRILAAKFLREQETDPITGKPLVETVRSTADLNVEEFGEYIELCIAWLADFFGIVVPPPEEGVIRGRR